MATTRSFSFGEGENTRSWSVSQVVNQLLIKTERNAGQESEIIQDFDSVESAKLAMEELIKEKVDAGYQETTQNPVAIVENRRLGKPESSLAQPSHVCEAKIFTVSTQSPGASWKSMSSLVLARSENAFLGLNQITLKKDSYAHFSFKSEIVFIRNYKNSKDAQKAFNKISKTKDLIEFVDHAETICQNIGEEKLTSESINLAKAKFSHNFKLLENPEVTYEYIDFQNIGDDEYSKLVKQVFESIRTGEKIPPDSFTVASVRKLVQRVADGKIADTWNECRTQNGTVDASKLNPESAYLLAFARLQNHNYGYWVYTKQLIKTLERLKSHHVVLASLYASLDQPKKIWYWHQEEFAKSISEFNFFAIKNPSKKTYLYLKRRARRYVSELRRSNLDSYLVMLLDFADEVKTAKFKDQDWIAAEFIYTTAWRDKNHGRAISLPRNSNLDNDLYLPVAVLDGLKQHQNYLRHIFDTTQSVSVATFAFQVLQQSNIGVELNTSRAKILIYSENLKLIGLVQEFLEQDFDNFISIFEYNLYAYLKYVIQPQAKVFDLLKKLIQKKDGWWYLDVAGKKILSTIYVKDQELFFDLIDQLKKEKLWKLKYLDEALVVRLLVHDFTRFSSTIGTTSVTLDSDYLYATWISELSKADSLPTEILLKLTKVMKQSFGTSLEIEGGLFAYGKNRPSVQSLVTQMFDEPVAANLARVFIAYSRNFDKNEPNQSVSAILATLIRSEQDLISILKFAAEFDRFDLVEGFSSISPKVLPWHSAVENRIKTALESESFIKLALQNKLPLSNLIQLAESLQASNFFNNLSASESVRKEAVMYLPSEFIRSDNPLNVDFIHSCSKEIADRIKNDLVLIYDLAASESTTVQQLSFKIASDLNIVNKIWIRLLESQLPLAIDFAQNYLRELSGKEFEDAILVCLDSGVTSAREVGLDLLKETASQVNLDRIYVNLAESTDPYIAALVAARAVAPGVSDAAALDAFDKRQMKTVRTGRKAKELIKKRRLESLANGSVISAEISELLNDLTMYGNDQDRDWAIEMSSLLKSFATTDVAVSESKEDSNANK